MTFEVNNRYGVGRVIRFGGFFRFGGGGMFGLDESIYIIYKYKYYKGII